MYSNRVMTTGFLGNDPESRTARNNSTFTRFPQLEKPGTGDYESETTWHRCVMYGSHGGVRSHSAQGSARSDRG
jgi:single-stranded DNA-binding protein